MCSTPPLTATFCGRLVRHDNSFELWSPFRTRHFEPSTAVPSNSSAQASCQPGAGAGVVGAGAGVLGAGAGVLGAGAGVVGAGVLGAGAGVLGAAVLGAGAGVLGAGAGADVLGAGAGGVVDPDATNDTSSMSTEPPAGNCQASTLRSTVAPSLAPT